MMIVRTGKRASFVAALGSLMLGGAAMLAQPALAQTELRLAHVQSPDSPSGRGTARFAELVSEYSDGRVTINVFPASQLGNNRKIMGSVRSGAVEMSITPYPLLADIVPELGVYTAGYFYDGWDHLNAVIEHEELGRTWAAALVENGGLRPVGTFYYGARSLTTTDTAATSPADVEGLKIRAVPNEMSLAVVRGLGGTPTPVAFPELFQALRQGTVDGQENPLPTIWAWKFYEVQNHLMLTRHQLIPLPWIINEDAWQELSAEDQEALMRAGEEAAAWTTEQTRQYEAELVDQLRGEGMTVTGEEDGLDLAAFRESVRSEVQETFAGEIWPEGLAERVIDLEH
jgi:tripartite ATP-independent transporter DctP family solute receptor